MGWGGHFYSSLKLKPSNRVSGVQLSSPASLSRILAAHHWLTTAEPSFF